MTFDRNNPPHVKYILLAEFDIGKGASLAHQYPSKTSMDAHVLAEMMLPDGVHQREEDWTIFFLNQSADRDVDPISKDITPKELLYVLSLVITKYDREALRGAHVKAMAICTRHRYLHIYKPVLLLALENYFRNPNVSVLESLYEAVNSMDVSLMPRFSIYEKMILRASEDKGMFEEKFLELEELQASSVDFVSSTNTPQFSTEDGTKTSAALKRHTYIDIPSGQRKEVQTSSKNKDRHFFETTVTYEKVKIPIRVPLTIFPEEVGDFSLINLINTFSSAPVVPHPFHPHLDTSGPQTHPIVLLLNALITEKRIIFLGHGLPSGQVANYVLAACAMASGSGIILRGFLERAFPYTSLSDIDSLLKFRGFIAGVANPTFEGHPKWWDVLCNISTGRITVSPFIGMGDDATGPATGPAAGYATGFTGSTAGPATVPAPGPVPVPVPAPKPSEQVPVSAIGSENENPTDPPGHQRTSSVSATTTLTPAPPGGAPALKPKDDKWDNSDTDFIHDVLQAIQSHYGELAIRAKFADYVQRFVGLAALCEEESGLATRIGVNPNNTPDYSGGQLGHGVVFVDEQSKQREISANRTRIEGWKESLSYRYYCQDFQRLLKERAIPNLYPARQISKLRMLRHLPDKELEAIYRAFLDNIVSSDQIIEFLAAVPQNQGGLTPITVALFHPNKTIRNYTVQFLNRIDQHQTGSRFIQNLNLFHKLAYERQCLAYEPNDENFKVLKSYVSDSSREFTDGLSKV